MPLGHPDEAKLKDVAARLGIPLSAAETRIFAERMHLITQALEKLLEIKIAESGAPPLRWLERDPGRPLTQEEDPLNLFIRRCLVRGNVSGPLSGHTVALKDNIAVAGVPMSMGSRLLEGFVPDFDASVVTRLLDAGAIIVGKTNMEGFSYGGAGIAGIGDFGRPRNPHDRGHVTGGSSSGSGAAVAAGAVDFALGGDQGGSIRNPAAWSGCIGLKATHGLIPHSGVFGLEPSLDSVGPMTRTVEDLAVVLKCLAGADGYDVRQTRLPERLPDYPDFLGRPVKGITIGVLSEGFGLPGAEQDVEDGVRDALGVLRGLGAALQDVTVPHHRIAPRVLAPSRPRAWPRCVQARCRSPGTYRSIRSNRSRATPPIPSTSGAYPQRR